MYLSEVDLFRNNNEIPRNQDKTSNHEKRNRKSYRKTAYLMKQDFEEPGKKFLPLPN